MGHSQETVRTLAGREILLEWDGQGTEEAEGLEKLEEGKGGVGLGDSVGGGGSAWDPCWV